MYSYILNLQRSVYTESDQHCRETGDNRSVVTVVSSEYILQCLVFTQKYLL